MEKAIPKAALILIWKIVHFPELGPKMHDPPHCKNLWRKHPTQGFSMTRTIDFIGLMRTDSGFVLRCPYSIRDRDMVEVFDAVDGREARLNSQDQNAVKVIKDVSQCLNRGRRVKRNSRLCPRCLCSLHKPYRSIRDLNVKRSQTIFRVRIQSICFSAKGRTARLRRSALQDCHCFRSCSHPML
jgi:hypothetical protein